MSLSSIELFGFVRICSLICSRARQIGLGNLCICSDLFGKGICRPHNNLERRRLREDVFRRRIPVFFEFIGYKSDAHSEAVHKAQSPHHAGDERVAIVGFHGEILWAGLAVEVAGVVELKTVGVLVNVCGRIASVAGSMLADVHEEFSGSLVGIANESLVPKGGDQLRTLALQRVFREVVDVL